MQQCLQTCGLQLLRNCKENRRESQEIRQIVQYCNASRAERREKPAPLCTCSRERNADWPQSQRFTSSSYKRVKQIQILYMQAHTQQTHTHMQTHTLTQHTHTPLPEPRRTGNFLASCSCPSSSSPEMYSDSPPRAGSKAAGAVWFFLCVGVLLPICPRTAVSTCRRRKSADDARYNQRTAAERTTRATQRVHTTNKKQQR